MADHVLARAELCYMRRGLHCLSSDPRVNSNRCINCLGDGTRAVVSVDSPRLEPYGVAIDCGGGKTWREIDRDKTPLSSIVARHNGVTVDDLAASLGGSHVDVESALRSMLDAFDEVD